MHLSITASLLFAISSTLAIAQGTPQIACATGQSVTAQYVNSGQSCGNPVASGLSSTLPVSQGGTGGVSNLAHALLIGEGTSAIAPSQVGISGSMMLGQGASTDPAFTTLSGDCTLTGSGFITCKPISLSGGAVGSVPYQSAANTTAFIASPTTSGHTFTPAWQPSGSAIAPTALDLTNFFASPPPIGSGTTNTIRASTLNVGAGSTLNFLGLLTSASVTPGSIGAGGCTDVSYTFTGVPTGAVIGLPRISTGTIVNGTNINLSGYQVTAANTVAVRYCNNSLLSTQTPTAGALTAFFAW